MGKNNVVKLKYDMGD